MRISSARDIKAVKLCWPVAGLVLHALTNISAAIN